MKANDAPAGEKRKARRALGAAAVGGVHRRSRRGRGGGAFHASVTVGALCLSTGEVLRRGRAVEHLQVLREIRAALLERRRAAAHFDKAACGAMRETLLAHGVDAAALGLRFHVQVSMRSWILPPLHTPHTQDLDAALRARGRLVAAAAPCARRSRSPESARRQWAALRAAYVAILEAHGQQRGRIAARLDALERAAEGHRERRLERWHRRAMAREDRGTALGRRPLGGRLGLGNMMYGGYPGVQVPTTDSPPTQTHLSSARTCDVDRPAPSGRVASPG